MWERKVIFNKGKDVRELIQAACGPIVAAAALKGDPNEWPYFITRRTAAEYMLQASSAKEVPYPWSYYEVTANREGGGR